MKRNKNIDIIRAFAILMVLIYHIYAITGIATKNNIIDTFLIYGGVVGVCIFFILSGFGIYNLLINKEDKKAKAVMVFKEEAIEKMIDALVN
jgi:peptidoglycan/LPS O-acetylase OafA/YrhL